MLRLLFWLLLIANGVLFSMQRGYLGAAASERHEPKRLAQQMNPETLTILPPNSEKLVPPVKAGEPATDSAANPVANSVVASSTADMPKKTEAEATPPLANAAIPPTQPQTRPEPKTATIACTEIGNFNGPEARRFDARLVGLNLAVKPVVRNIQEAGSYMVYIPSQDGKEGADRKSAELRRLDIQDFYVIPDSQPNPSLRWAISLGVFKTEEAAKAYIGQLIPRGVRSSRIVARNAASTRQAYQWRNIDLATKAALDGLKAKFPNQEIRTCAG